MTTATAHCGHEWRSSHTAAGWREHSCVRPAGHDGEHRCGCLATDPPPRTDR